MVRLARLTALCLALGAPLAATSGAQTKNVRPAMARQIRQAMDRGAGYLMGGPVADLATRGRRSKSHRPSDGLCLYAALHAGGRRDGDLIRAASDALAKQSIKRTYEAACAIMALSLSDSSRYQKSIQTHAKFLERSQKNGAWGYPSGEDLSNTQYAALGLWTAHKAGATVSSKVWRDLARALPAFQNEEGGFSYHRTNGAASVSMTAAGIACAEICMRMLGEGQDPGSRWTRPELHDLQVIEARALEWMADAFDEGLGTHSGSTLPLSLYALYGTERAAELTDTPHLGTHDWYREGAQYLVQTQAPTGAWKGSDAQGIETSFALLFLARATRKASAPISGPASSKPAAVLSLEDGLDAPPGSDAFEAALARLHRRDLGRNLLPSMGPRFRASSQSVGQCPALLADQRRTTWWSPGRLDKRVRLEISFDEPKEIDTLLISGALELTGAPVSGHPEGGKGPSPQRLLVRVNGRLYPVIMPRDKRLKGRLELPGKVLLESLQIMDPREDESLPARVLRLGEIEAQLR